MTTSAQDTAQTTDEVTAWLAAFAAALEARDVEQAVSLFLPEGCTWRDFLAFTWNITTEAGPDAIRAMLASTLAEVEPAYWAVVGTPSRSDGFTEAWLSFSTKSARARAHVRLVGGKALTFFTAMEELKGHEEPTGPRRAMGNIHEPVKGRTSWIQDRTRHQERFGYEEQPFCVVIGGGQSGIIMGARLKRLGVPTLIVDRNERPGDSWRNRYNSLCLHDPVWYDHLPYIPFPDDWPIFSPKDKLADWMEMYTKVQELDYWGGTECTNATFDEAAGAWEVNVSRHGEAITLRPQHVIFAVGLTGKPVTPSIPGADRFKGVQYHSAEHRSGEWVKGRRAVVVGARNSAFDIVLDLWEQGCTDITMVQRSATHILKSETLREMLAPLYSDESTAAGLSADEADFIRFTLPLAMYPQVYGPFWKQERKKRKDYYASIEKSGFKLTFGGDGTGVTAQAFRTGSGYYIDEGTTELLVNGAVKLKSGAVQEIREDSVVFDDGSELETDLIVYATGYNSMSAWVEDLVSRETADQLGRCWGYGSGHDGDPGPWEGELRNIAKPTAVPNLWVHGGGLGASRFYSRFLALQMKARLEGIPTPVYGTAPVHHKR